MTTEGATQSPPRAPEPVNTAIGPADPGPRIVNTRRGPVECAVAGDGPAILALHGAMGGHDQAWLLARTLGAPGFRYVALSRPGYLGTPLAIARTRSEKADLYRDVLDALAIRDALVLAVSGGGPSALQFAASHRERCRGAVIVSAGRSRAIPSAPRAGRSRTPRSGRARSGTPRPGRSCSRCSSAPSIACGSGSPGPRTTSRRRSATCRCRSSGSMSPSSSSTARPTGSRASPRRGRWQPCRAPEARSRDSATK